VFTFSYDGTIIIKICQLYGILKQQRNLGSVPGWDEVFLFSKTPKSNSGWNQPPIQ